jgi:hypothetical protein
MKYLLLLCALTFTVPTAFAQDRSIMEVFEAKNDHDIIVRSVQTIGGIVEMTVGFNVLKYTLNGQFSYKTKLAKGLSVAGFAALLIDGTLRVIITLNHVKNGSWNTEYEPGYSPLLTLTGVAAKDIIDRLDRQFEVKGEKLTQEEMLSILEDEGIESEKIEDILERIY